MVNKSKSEGDFTLTVYPVSFALLPNTLSCMHICDTVLITFGIDSYCPLFFITALIIYGADIDYSRRFHEKGDDFIVDDDDLMLMRDNGSLVATFPSGKTNNPHSQNVNTELFFFFFNEKVKQKM